jgi:hypothetical protein
MTSSSVAGAKLHYICMKKTWYEYEVGGGLNHKNKQRPTSYTNDIHTLSPVPEPEGRYIRVWQHPYDYDHQPLSGAKAFTYV